MRTVVVGTAGHIDHGKSELVRALTGTHPDRLREERDRGITIDIGFANLVLPGIVLSFVDVPGHERFIKNMLAGASGIDLVLLVIAADESVRPQTREHFHICRLLGLTRGVIALTKTDLVDAELVEVAGAEAREFVEGSFLDRAEMVPVSARTGEGIPALVQALARAAEGLIPRDAGGSARLPVDRSFTVRGFGAVVTGTLVAGTIRTGDELELLTARRSVKVRGIESRSEAVTSVVAGQRSALNLQGVSHQEIARGDVLAEPGAFEPTSIFDAAITILEDAPSVLRDLARVRLHAGTAEILARIRPLGRTEVVAGAHGYAQFRLERPAVLVPGERFIFRRYSPATTLGGGVVLDVFPPKRRRADAAAPAELAHLESQDAGARAVSLVAFRGARGITVADLVRRVGVRWSEIAHRLQRPVREGTLLVLTHPREPKNLRDPEDSRVARDHGDPKTPGDPADSNNRRNPVASADARGPEDPAGPAKASIRADPKGFQTPEHPQERAQCSDSVDSAVPGGAVGSAGPGGLLISEEGFDTIRAAAEALLREFHARSPLLPGFRLEEFRSKLAPAMHPEEIRIVLGELERRGVLKIERDVAAAPGHRVALSEEDDRLAEAISSIFRDAGLAPPEAAEALGQARAAGPRGEAVLGHLLRAGVLKRLRDGRLFHREALDGLTDKLRERRRTVETIDVGAFKELTGVSRKHAIPLLEYLDEQRVTLRRGNERVILI